MENNESKVDTPKKLPSESFTIVLQSIIQNRISFLCMGVTIGTGFYSLSAFTSSLIITFGTIGCGVHTNCIFARTCEHIDKFGYLDDKYFKTTLGENMKDLYSGYCSLQGIYLATKKYGIEDQFFALKKKHSRNKIPNF